MILSTGNAAFDDVSLPAPGKSEFGMDTLTRKMMGERAGLAVYLASLKQGDVFEYNDVPFYLQTWDPNDATPFATVTLQYKGLIAGPPAPDIINEIVSAAGNVAKSYVAENAGKGRAYRKETLWKSFFVPLLLPGVEEDVQFGIRDVYTTGAQMEFTYDAVQSAYRYIATGKPGGPANSRVDIYHNSQIRRARITTADGTQYGKERAAFFELVPVELETVVSFQCKNVIGTNYYECLDVVRKELVQPEGT